MPLHVKLIAEERAAETALRTPALITCNGFLSRTRESSREENSTLVPAWGGQNWWELWRTDFDPRATDFDGSTYSKGERRDACGR
jgi:hypothetical protein